MNRHQRYQRKYYIAKPAVQSEPVKEITAPAGLCKEGQSIYTAYKAEPKFVENRAARWLEHVAACKTCWEATK